MLRKAAAFLSRASKEVRTKRPSSLVRPPRAVPPVAPDAPPLGVALFFAGSADVDRRATLRARTPPTPPPLPLLQRLIAPPTPPPAILAHTSQAAESGSAFAVFRAPPRRVKRLERHAHELLLAEANNETGDARFSTHKKARNTRRAGDAPRKGWPRGLDFGSHRARRKLGPSDWSVAFAASAA